MPEITLIRGDAELIAHTLKGEDRAFRELVNRYSSLIYNYIYRMTSSMDLADEMTQETFVKIYKNLASFDAQRPFKPWALRIASNVTISALRKNKKTSQESSMEALQEENPSIQWVSENTPDPSTEVENKDLSQAVLRAIEGLDPQYRQALILRYSEELSYEEIASTLDKPINTIRTWIKRGRERLREHVKELIR